MKLTPAIKGQLTKAIRKHADDAEALTVARPDWYACVESVRAVFVKHMPREQAKHATRKYLAGLAA